MQPSTNTPDFEETVADEVVLTTGEGTSEEPQDELTDEVEDDTNLDVDVPRDELDEVSTDAESGGAEGKAKPASTPRTKAPEGFVKPVEFAKILSEHLEKTVPPQVVYSYIKNNSGESAKNPFPVHEVDGYAWYIKPAEGLAWWDAKNSRVATSKAARAEKAQKQAAKAAAEAPAEVETAPVVEAE